MDTDKSNFEYFSKNDTAYQNKSKYWWKCKYIKTKECKGCGNISNSIKLFNDHIRTDDDCSIYYKLDYLTYKIWPNQCRNTIWETYNDLEKH